MSIFQNAILKNSVLLARYNLHSVFKRVTLFFSLYINQTFRNYLNLFLAYFTLSTTIYVVTSLMYDRYLI
jgi:hypothetical protein